jgi:hypothetical protein
VLVYKIQVIIFFLLFIISCSNSDLDKLSNVLSKKILQEDGFSSINQQPIAIITINENIAFKENMDITFDASSSFDPDGSISSYLWKNEGKIIGNTKSISIKLPSAIHIIELEIKDNQGSIGKTKKQISVGLDFNKIKLDINLVEEIATLKFSTKNINQLAINNNYLYAASNDGHIYYWELFFSELLNPNFILASKDYEIKNLLIRKNKIFSASSKGDIKIWDIKTKQLLKTIKNHTNVITSTIANDKIIAFSSIDKTISIISLESNNILTTITGHKSPITTLEIIRNFLISYSSNKIIKIWDINNNYKNVSTIDLDNKEVDFMLIHKDKLITASKNGLIIIRDIFKNTIIKEKQIDPIRAISIYKDNIIVALDNKNIDLINIDDFTSKNILQLDYKATSIYINEGILAISLDNQNIKIFGNKERLRKNK